MSAAIALTVRTDNDYATGAVSTHAVEAEILATPAKYRHLVGLTVTTEG